MQPPLTSTVSTHGHPVALFPSSRLLEGYGERLDSRQPEVADGAPRTSACRTATSPTSIFPTSGGRVHADHR
jgi:hypothetical protein